MSILRSAPSMERRKVEWVETVHALAEAHRSRRYVAILTYQSIGARHAWAHDGGTEPGAASGGGGDPDAAPVHRPLSDRRHAHA